MSCFHRNCEKTTEDHEREGFDRLSWGLMVVAIIVFVVAMVFGR